MFRSFIEWLDEYLVDKEPAVVVSVFIGIMGFAALLGSIFGNSAVKAGLLISVIFIALILALLLLADRRRIKNAATLDRTLLSLYCRFLSERHGPVARIKSWNQVATVDADGNSKEFVTIHAVVLRKELYFLTLKFGPKWDQPEKEKRKVKVKVHSLLVEGVRGTSWRTTENWIADGRLELISHFHAPAKMGEEIRLEIEWDWPAKCTPLMKRCEPDEFVFGFTKLMPAEFVSYKVTLPVGVSSYCEPVGFSTPNIRFSAIETENDDKTRSYTFTGRELKAGHQVGMRLEIK